MRMISDVICNDADEEDNLSNMLDFRATDHAK